MTVALARSRARRLDPGERRSLLVQAAVRAAARYSLTAFTAAQVASEAGVSKAAVFKYFPDHRALAEAVVTEVERYYAGLLERVRDSASDPVRRLVDLSVAYAASLETHFDHAKIVMSWSTVVEHPWMVERLGGLFLGYVAFVDADIREGISQGRIPSDIDVELAAWTYVGYSTTLGAAKFFGRPPEWIYHLQIALLRSLFGAETVDRVLSGGRSSGLTSNRPR